MPPLINHPSDDVRSDYGTIYHSSCAGITIPGREGAPENQSEPHHWPTSFVEGIDYL
eukprot:Ihof_evm32s2 gene=Ihof_evmTU32s2